MIELAGSEGHAIPVMWWLWWFVVATVVYTVIGVWFWKTLSRDRPPPAGAEQQGRSH